MNPEKSLSSNSAKRFSQWLRSGSLREMNHASHVRTRKHTPKIEDDLTEFDENASPSSHEKHPRRTKPVLHAPIALTPTHELEIIHTEEGPSIAFVDYEATPEDVENRIAEQNQRILSKPFDSRTHVEQKWLDKNAQ